jgi:LPXTG-motif cell wall-anchored protein
VLLNNEGTVITLSIVGGIAAVGIGIFYYLRNRRKKAVSIS